MRYTLILFALLALASCNDSQLSSEGASNPNGNNNPNIVKEQSPSVASCADGAFKSVWFIDSSNLILELPLVFGFDYNFYVDWGDGTGDFVYSATDPNKYHWYDKEGKYTVTITGKMEAFSLAFNPNRSDIVGVLCLGSLGWKSLEGAFANSTIEHFESGNKVDTSSVTTMDGMFNNAQWLVYADLSSFNTSNVTDMRYMFNSNTNLLSVDLSSFDTSNVTDMSHMFNNATLLTTLDLSNFNTSKVADMSSMFRGTYNLDNLNISNFNTSEVVSMNNMFSFYRSSLPCSESKMIDLSHFNTSNVTDMTSLFNGSRLTEYNLNNWDIDQVTFSTSASGESCVATWYCDPATLGAADFFGKTCN